MATLTVMTFCGQHVFTYTVHFVEIHVVDRVVRVIFVCECNKGISAVLCGYEVRKDTRTVICLLWELYVTDVAERAEQREKRRFGHLCVEATCVSTVVTYPHTASWA